jgi:hypothetical protein
MYSTHRFVGERFYVAQLKHLQGTDFISDIQKQWQRFIQAKYQEQKHRFLKRLFYIIQGNAANMRNFMT